MDYIIRWKEEKDFLLSSMKVNLLTFLTVRGPWKSLRKINIFRLISFGGHISNLIITESFPGV